MGLTPSFKHNTQQLPDWRSRTPVLITEAQSRFSIAVIRSLGRAGYPVHACSNLKNATGCFSSYAWRSGVCPDYKDAGFIAWLDDYILQNNIRCIIPSELLLSAIRPAFQHFSHLLPMSTDEAIVYRGMSKFDLFETLLDEKNSQHNLPASLLIRKHKPFPDEDDFARLGSSVYLKVDNVHSQQGSASTIHHIKTPREAVDLTQRLLLEYDRILAQGFVEGIGVGAFLLRWDGKILADFMHMRLHEVPALGHSSYRKSWWNDEIMRDAEAKLQRMNWQGVAMMEYRWDEPTGQFALLEMNGRFWGSLHLPLYAGVDFPVLLLDAFCGHASEQRISGRNTVTRCRNTYPLELMYMVSELKDNNKSFISRVSAIPKFFLPMINPRIHSDLMFPGDRRLYWIALWQYIKQGFKLLATSMRSTSGKT